jgi:hypothetical protein
VADREARRLCQTIRARQAEVKAQLQRITFIDEAANLVGDDCFGFHLAMETNTRELGIIHYILSASDNALDATRNLNLVRRQSVPRSGLPSSNQNVERQQGLRLAKQRQNVASSRQGWRWEGPRDDCCGQSRSGAPAPR